MNDISFLATTEQDPLLAVRDSNLAKSENDSGAEFLSQLHNAHDSIELEKKGNEKPQAEAENSIAAPKHKQPQESEAQNEEQNTKLADEDAVIVFMSGDNMLAQINSAQTMNTSVNKPADTLNNTELKNSLHSLVTKSGDESPLMQNTSSAIVGSETTPSDDSQSGGENTFLLNENKHYKSTLAQAIEGQFSDNKKPIQDKIEVNQSPKVASENGQSTALTNLLAKEMGSTAADKVIASLTSEQRLQLNTQAQAITNSSSSNVSNTSSLKEMLAQFITDNEQTQSTAVKQRVSSEINTLNTSEKQALLTQLNAYIKTEQPQGEQLKALKQTVSELEASIEIKLVDSAKIKPNTFVAGETPNTVNTVAQASSKSVNKADAEVNKITVSNDDDLAKQLEQLSKEGLKSTTAEQSSPRVAQIFTQLTAAFNTVQANSTGLYEGLNYDQGLADTQLLQSQQLQSAAQVKQVSIDPDVMQAINIVKSDAAKLLQERVSSMLSINNKEAEIRLDPPEMGSMQIRIRSDAEQAQINFVVQSQQAKEALEQSMPRLREMLAQQGLELGESTISYGQSGGENPDQSDGGTQAGLANNESVNGENDEQANSVSQSSRQQSSSSIDYYA
ncbi:flagellar hook-length control protein FliK [Pseudoalteromonas sp. MMG006]|uniref:flagellar hook-length control protein FliK n=1 Tax=Pseudoalteromonas sp. MMG006 TaxID=2822683 RepID=UPI001B35E9D3|nr:flagellar hook-length control protein FliK [Pseudoalteromonas sp. MMG006]MBQ4797808.1 flagellar hook-length control protein FliK [Pseudoalteromonas sp. MMG006]